MNHHRFKTLLDMLTWCRPAGSTTERAFLDRYLAPVSGVREDAFGNWHRVIGDDPTVLWSSHTDTVARQPGRQTIHVDSVGFVQLSKRAKRDGRNCLGADDTVGVWIMLEMINAGIPGHYIFHYGEEVGCQGSTEYADAKLIEPTVTAAIAFDRHGHRDVITHQAGDRCASDAFTASLAAMLPTGYTGAHGIWTDTASYVDHIRECTNLSVGYQREHTPDESVYLPTVERLLDSLLAFDASKLNIQRTPDPRRWSDGWQRWGHTVNTVADGDYVDPGRYPHVTFAECLWCGDWYRVADSLAFDYDNYCTPDCETSSRDLRMGTRTSGKSIYLTEEQDAVARHLRIVR